MIDLLTPLEVLISIIANPVAMIGLALGALVSLLVHWLFPESSLVFQALPAAVGFACGIVYSWRPSQFREPEQK